VQRAASDFPIGMGLDSITALNEMQLLFP